MRYYLFLRMEVIALIWVEAESVWVFDAREVNLVVLGDDLVSRPLVAVQTAYISGLEVNDTYLGLVTIPSN